MTHKSLPSFFQTLSLELNAQADRVRQLIGSAHWISDGNHKESLLRNVIERYVPDATVTGRAFIVDATRSSTEQDIAVINTYVEKPLFNQSGLIIAARDSLLATISVKTTFKKDELLDAMAGLSTVPFRADSAWQGVYFFNPTVSGLNLRGKAEKLRKWVSHPRRACSPRIAARNRVCSRSDCSGGARVRVGVGVK